MHTSITTSGTRFSIYNVEMSKTFTVNLFLLNLIHLEVRICSEESNEACDSQLGPIYKIFGGRLSPCLSQYASKAASLCNHSTTRSYHP